MKLDLVDSLVRALGGASLVLVITVLMVGLVGGSRRPAGQATSDHLGFLRSPLFYLVAATSYFGLCALLWRPLPIALTPVARILSLILGAALYFPGLALVLWGRVTLGRHYGASSTLGAQLFAGHRLITHGPYGYVRHPMYLGLLLVALGGLLIYQTWTFVFFLANFPVFFVRARREERALSAAFGEEWETYRRRVPPWFPDWPRR
jgi:protein-S-isoprenylcysteine O-methyltransferase Ste14